MKNINKPIYQRPWNPEWGTVIQGDSLTVPGEAYTIQQLFERANAGVPLDVSVNVREGFYADDADFDTFAPENDFEFSDAHESAVQAMETIADANAKLKASKGGKNARKEEKATHTQAIDEEAEQTTPEAKKPENGAKND